ncbi:hypothetical protein M3Y94_00327700 [Aphelenchoides besseyi]|nr:hypothetical protein M3Y94_00327700 [Aphelenchoides besseyi]
MLNFESSENLRIESLLRMPLAGSAALSHVNWEHKNYGSTIYFLSFVKRLPRPKETFRSYQKFIARSRARLRLLNEYSKQLRLIGEKRKSIAQQVLNEKTLKNLKNESKLLFQLPVRVIIPRSQKYMEMKQRKFGSPESRQNEVNRLMATLVVNPVMYGHVRKRSNVFNQALTSKN